MGLGQEALQPRLAEDDARQDLADDERQPDRARELAEEPRGAEQDGEREEKDERVVAVHAGYSITGSGHGIGHGIGCSPGRGGALRRDRRPRTWRA